MITLQKRKGSILVFTLLILSFILITAFSVASVALIERRGSGATVNSTTAFQNADKGMEDFLQQLYKDMDQSDELGDMSLALGADYNCVDGSGSVPAHMGNDDTDYIIYAYKEGVGVQTGDSGWTSVDPIITCDTRLADVSRFKITGNHNNAVRAVFVKLRDSLTRDLIAHWSFEDRAQVDVLLADTEETFSMTAQDASKNSHILTLCNFKDTVDIRDELNNDLGQVVEFPSSNPKVCAEDSSSYMNPKKRKSGSVDEKRYNNDGAWVDGHVTESDDGVTTPSSEALYFDGNDFLAMYVDSTSNNCEDEYNCVKDGEDKLRLTDGITISLWVNPVELTNDSVLITRNGGNNVGFRLYVSLGKLCMRLNGKEACTDNINSTANGKWHHVVGRWDKTGDKKVNIVFDGVQKHGDVLTADISDVHDKIVYVGKKDRTTGYFKGMIDDIRIWDRRLTDEEVSRLCVKSQIGVSEANKVHCLP